MSHLKPCNLCASESFKPVLCKDSIAGTRFDVVKCSQCGLVQVNPQPTAEELKPYYASHYFEKRTDRGYNDYFSDSVKNSIAGVYQMNLIDLNFPEIERKMLAARSPAKPRSLDVGCAAGYFVELMQNRGWDASGIELSAHAASFGIERGLAISVGDFLEHARTSGHSHYDLITLWASLEHMPDPKAVLLAAFQALQPGGQMILSTCRYGVLAKLHGIRWRYMNLPEHLYFFTKGQLRTLATQCGFQWEGSISYGSGFTAKTDAGFFYKAMKRAADRSVKLLDQGDMIALRLSKPEPAL